MLVYYANNLVLLSFKHVLCGLREYVVPSNDDTREHNVRYVSKLPLAVKAGMVLYNKRNAIENISA